MGALINSSWVNPSQSKQTPPGVPSSYQVIQDFPIIGTTTGPIINSIWMLPLQSKQAPNGVPSSYQVIQDFPPVAATVIRIVFTSPAVAAIDDQPVRNQSINVEQNIWERIIRIANVVVRAISETIALSESVLRKVTRPVAETLHLVESVLRRYRRHYRLLNLS